MNKWKWLASHGMLFAEDGGGDGGGDSGGGDGGDGGQPPEGSQQQQQQPADTLPQDRDSLINIIKSLRKENGDERVAGKQKAAEEARNEMVQQIGKILGLVDEKPTVETLAEQIKALQSGGDKPADEKPADNTPLVELAIFKTAKEHGGNADRLTDSVSFLAKVRDLDPTASDFQSKVAAAAKEAVAADSSLKAGNGSASSVEPPGGSERAKKSISIESAVGKALGG